MILLKVYTHFLDVPCVDVKYAIDMKQDADKAIENEPIFIGKIIEEELRRQERSVTCLSRKIHCDRRNIYDIFSRTSIDTGLLYKLSVALHKDFFACFSTNLQTHGNQSSIQTPPG